MKRWMAAYTITPKMLAAGIGYSASHMRYILQGKRRVLPEMIDPILSYFQQMKQEYLHRAAIIAELDACA
jgi:plasmid maintenance system antidote protein VapI